MLKKLYLFRLQIVFNIIMIVNIDIGNQEITNCTGRWMGGYNADIKKKV